MSQELIRARIEAPETVSKFSTIFAAIQKVDPEVAKQMFEVERFHFLKECTEKSLSDVSEISAMGCFLDVISNGLSFASGAKHVYLMYRNVKTGNGYEKRMVYSTSPDGKIFQAQRAGSIDYVTKPVIVYEGDEFAVGTNERGEQIIRHQVKFPRSSQKIVAGYVYVVHKNGNREPYWMDMNDINRLKGYSERQNKGTANALYSASNGQIDPGFFGAKLINFALKNVRKSGTASQFEVDADPGDDLLVIDQSSTYTPTAIVSPVTEPAPVVVTETTSPKSKLPF
jgi:recombinational DNA repair protein RecT